MPVQTRTPAPVAGRPLSLGEALRRPELWPGGRAPVLERETHASLVLLTGDRAWKVRKPVRFPFLDYGTLEARRAAALEEVRLNEELAPDTYLGVRPIIRSDDGFRVGPAGTRPAGTVEHVVEMRRFDERDTLAERLADRRVTPELLGNLGRRLAGFHGAAPRADPPAGGAAAALARLHRNMEDLIELRGRDFPLPALAVLSRALEAAVLRDADVHDARARAGCWREGHGDLRTDHVVWDARGLRVVDRLEFDRGLRCDDVAADLAYLLMDLEARDARWAAHLVLEAYRDAGGDAGDDRLLAFWTAYRALVAAKIAWLRARQGSAAAAAVGAARFALARRCAWRTRLPLVLVFCGAPATGKSTLAAEAAGRSGLPVVSSDRIRKALRGIAPEQRAPAAAYSDAASLALYEELGHRAARAVADGGGVIVDATMRRRSLRTAFAAGLGDAAPVVLVECRTPPAEAQRRARERQRDPATVSDAGPRVAAALSASFESLDEVLAGRHISVRGDGPAAAALDAIEASLDARGSS